MSNAVAILVPHLGAGIDEAVLTQWLVAPGEVVTAGQPVALVETDKATLEVPSPRAGRVLDVLIFAGDRLPPGAALATLKPA